ncbi:MAG TPA: hypothetical protein VGL81_09125 [Polyangiaceae bacterium]|jgi:hypothetical protein
MSQHPGKQWVSKTIARTHHPVDLKMTYTPERRELVTVGPDGGRVAITVNGAPLAQGLGHTTLDPDTTIELGQLLVQLGQEAKERASAPAPAAAE